MSGKGGKGAARAVPRTHGRLTGYERDTVQRMLKRRVRSATSSRGSRAYRPAGSAYRTKSVSGGFIQSTEYGYLVLWCNSSQTSPSPHFSGFSRPSALMP